MDALLIFPRKWFVPPDGSKGSRPVRDEIDTLCQNINGPSISQNPHCFSPKGDDVQEVFPGKSSGQPRDASNTADLLPYVDLQALDEAYIMTMELPGVPPEMVAVHVCGNCLTVSGEKKREKRINAKDLVAECVYGRFSRMWNLPDDAEANAISAMHRNGILTIMVPRKRDGNSLSMEDIVEN